MAIIMDQSKSHTPIQPSNSESEKDPENFQEDQKNFGNLSAGDFSGGDSSTRQDEKPLLKWNASLRTTCKSLTTFYSMLLLGLNDAVYGVSFRLEADLCSHRRLIRR